MAASARDNVIFAFNAFHSGTLFSLFPLRLSLLFFVREDTGILSTFSLPSLSSLSLLLLSSQHFHVSYTHFLLQFYCPVESY